MNNKSLFIVAGVVAALLAFGAYYLGAQSTKPSETNNATQGELIDPETGKRVLYWHDPMVPGRRFDKPGKSPFMDMQLVPVYANEATGDGGVSVDPRVQQRLGLRTATVERKVLAPTISAVGNVEYNERDVAVVQARAGGYIERVHARTPLQTVTAGQPLADVYVPEWVAAQEELFAVQRMQSGAREALLNATKQRMRLAGMTDAQIDAAAQGNGVQARMTLRAPIAGVVSELMAREGMTVMSGTPLFRINGLKTVWIYAEIPEAQLPRIQAGAKVTAHATAFPDTPLTGVVLAILPGIDAATRTAKARIELSNDKRLLTPGMFVTVQVTTAASAPVLAVPSEALIVTGERTIAIVEEDSRFKPVQVTSGAESDGFTEVRSGLEEGQRVVVSAQFLIDSEANLKAATERIGAPSPPPSPGTGRGGNQSDSPGTGGGGNQSDSPGNASPLPVPGEVERSSGEGHGAHK